MVKCSCRRVRSGQILCFGDIEFSLSWSVPIDLTQVQTNSFGSYLYTCDLWGSAWGMVIVALHSYNVSISVPILRNSVGDLYRSGTQVCYIVFIERFAQLYYIRQLNRVSLVRDIDQDRVRHFDHPCYTREYRRILHCVFKLIKNTHYKKN